MYQVDPNKKLLVHCQYLGKLACIEGVQPQKYLKQLRESYDFIMASGIIPEPYISVADLANALVDSYEAECKERNLIPKW